MHSAASTSSEAVSSTSRAWRGKKDQPSMTDYLLAERRVPLDDSWDVIVVGGGPAGCATAISAARAGAKTLLVEATGTLGGMGTSGLVPAWCPRGLPKHPRPHFHSFGFHCWSPQASFDRFYAPMFARQGPKHRQEQPRDDKNLPIICQEPAET